MVTFQWKVDHVKESGTSESGMFDRKRLEVCHARLHSTLWENNPIWDDRSDSMHSGDTTLCKITAVTLHTLEIQPRVR